MKKKLLASILLTSLVGTILSGCQGAGSTDKTGESTSAVQSEAKTDTEKTAETKASIVTAPTELTFIFADGDEGAKASMNEIVNRFNQTYPDITVKIQPGNGGAYSEFLKTKESVGEFPDIMEMRDTPVYVRAGMLSPLPDSVVSLFKSTVAFDGKTYTAPIAGENTQGIIYNKKYFDENGFTEPKTYEEFLDLCQKIKDKGDMSPLVIGGQDIWHIGFWFYKAYNDQVLSKDQDFIKHCYDESKDFSDPSIKATFEELQNVFQYAQDGWVSTPDAQITTFLVSDMAAMMYSGTHMFAQIAAADTDFEIGWFPVPSPDGKVRLIGGGGAGGLAISAEAAKDPNKKAAAEAFIRFFFEPESYKVYCNKLNAIPSTVETPNLSAAPVMMEVIDATNTADDLSVAWNGRIGENELPPDFRNFMYKTTIEVIQGQRDIPSACEELNKTWKVAMQSFNPVKSAQ
jgi:raffinose/stachyose/melibiose transport system substrate-binding protein